MSKNNEVIAIGCADIHLQHKPPIWRSAEPDWYEAMRRPLEELSALQEKYSCPVLNAGDVFDDWNSPAELINFAIKYLPDQMYTIPGQHDLPNHNIQELHRSAFSSILLTGKFTFDINTIYHNNFVSTFFSFGNKLLPNQYAGKAPNIAVIHEYLWVNKSTCYKTATKETSISKYNKKKNFIDGKLFGYDIIISGDNHIGWQTKLGKTTIVNCGSLMRRRKDQIDYDPCVWLIYNNGTVKPHFLDISKDKYLELDDIKLSQVNTKPDIDMEGFAKELKKLSSSALDFSDAMKHYCTKNKVKKQVKGIITKAMKNE